MRQYILVLTFLLAGVLGLRAQTVNVPAKIYYPKSPHNRLLVNKIGVLTFDDNDRVLTFKDDGHDKLQLPYDSVTGVVFEVTTHMRGFNVKSALAGGVPLVGIVAGPLVSSQHVHNYWFYVEYNKAQQKSRLLLEVPSDCSQKVIHKAKSVLGDRVTVADYPENGHQVDPDKLSDIKSKVALRIDKHDHPAPEVKPDKAQVVVVCPSLPAGPAGRRIQFKVHANDHVVAVNKWGTYSFAYLDPGKYRLISQAENAYGFDIDLEPGKSYYFLQNTFQGVFKSQTSLTRNSPELVTYLLDGSYYSDWKPK